MPYKDQINQKAFVKGDFGNLNDLRFLQKGYQALGPNGQVIQTSLSSESMNGDDGYWVTLQGWSSCTVKCGGGT